MGMQVGNSVKNYLRYPAYSTLYMRPRKGKKSGGRWNGKPNFACPSPGQGSSAGGGANGWLGLVDCHGQVKSRSRDESKRGLVGISRSLWEEKFTQRGSLGPSFPYLGTPSKRNPGNNSQDA